MATKKAPLHPTDQQVEFALAAFSKGNHPAHATLEDRMRAALQSVAYSEHQATPSELAKKAAADFYHAPMGLLYSVNNGYHDVAIDDLARELQKFAQIQKDRG